MAAGSGLDVVRLPAATRSAARFSQAGSMGVGAAGAAGVSQPALGGRRVSGADRELARGANYIAPPIAALTRSAGDGAHGRSPLGVARRAASGDWRGARRNTEGGFDLGRAGDPGGFR